MPTPTSAFQHVIEHDDGRIDHTDLALDKIALGDEGVIEPPTSAERTVTDAMSDATPTTAADVGPTTDDTDVEDMADDLGDTHWDVAEPFDDRFVRGGLPQLGTVALNAAIDGSTSGVELALDGRLTEDFQYQTIDSTTLSGGEEQLRQVDVAAFVDLRLRATNTDGSASAEVVGVATGGGA